MVDTDQESFPLVENMQQSEDHLEICIAKDDLEPGPECCIYKVPIRLREVKEIAYTPRFISIGPIHHGNRNLAKMERQKLRYQNKFCGRTSKNTLEGFRSFIEGNAKQIYRCYDEFAFETEFEASQFVTMVLNDAVFIIELLLRHYEKKDDFLLNREWLSLGLQVDLFLLENQLPFFVLEDLYKLAFGSSGTPSFLHLSCVYFGFQEDLSLQKKQIKHFTDLVRHFLVRNHPSESGEKINKVYNATKLHEAGVEFKADFGVRFEKGELRLPRLPVGQGSEALIRNVMALEHCHYQKDAYICSYFQLLDHLVDTDKDVDLLVKKGIFVNLMGSNAAVAVMINNLMVGFAQIPPFYAKIGKDLNQHHDNSWNRTKATLRHVYFNNLLKGTATVAAFMALLFTFTQTLLAILERAKPKK